MKKLDSGFRRNDKKWCLSVFSDSTFDVGRSMFDVHFFQYLLSKNNLAHMGEALNQIARASVRTSTYLAPDFSKTLAHSFAVVPVV